MIKNNCHSDDRREEESQQYKAMDGSEILRFALDDIKEE